MNKLKKIETNAINFIFNDYKIKDEYLTNILGGETITVEVRCSGDNEKLKKSDHSEKCSASNTTLRLSCNIGATLSAVVANVKIVTQATYVSGALSVVNF